MGVFGGSSTSPNSSRVLLAVATLVTLLTSTLACYVGRPQVTQCGGGRLPVRIATVFPLNHTVIGYIDWGDQQDELGNHITQDFMARESNYNFSRVFDDDYFEGYFFLPPILGYANGGYEHLLELEHDYQKAGTYSISLMITIYRDEDVSGDDDVLFANNVTSTFENSTEEEEFDGSFRLVPCITAQTPAVGSQWLLTVSEDSECKVEFREEGSSGCNGIADVVGVMAVALVIMSMLS